MSKADVPLTPKRRGKKKAELSDTCDICGKLHEQHSPLDYLDEIEQLNKESDKILAELRNMLSACLKPKNI